jgi:two-component system OmpR family response regulator
MATIGICEDEPSLRRLLRRALENDDHQVILAQNGGEALRLFGVDRDVHAIVMDIGLPDADGRDVCAALKSAGQQAPVLFLTALDEVEDRLSGFDVGADDYVTKPFQIREVLARLAVLVRRNPAFVAPQSGLALDPTTHSVRTATGQSLLTPTEYRVLAAITSRPGEVVRRRTVIAAGWPDGADVSENSLDAFIRRVRAKLDEVASPVQIQTVRGVGFRVS